MPRYWDTAHRQMREAALDAAAVAVIAHGWQGLQMRAVAAEIGVSRQTLYNTFTDKRGLAAALVERMTQRFLVGVESALAEHDTIRDQWRAAIRYTLDTAGDDPLLKTVLTADGRDELLPLLTNDAAPVITATRERLTTLVCAAHPGVSAAAAGDAIESATRLAISHIVLPLHPSETVAEHIATLVERFLAP